MNTEPTTEIWQVEVGAGIYDASFEDMTTWIADGSLLRIDRVRKGNLRWIEAGKVPSLTEFFNAKESTEPSGPVITTTRKETLGIPEPAGNFINAEAQTGLTEDMPVCSVHGDTPSNYVCETCGNTFCKACPTSYGSNVKICPYCGAMCTAITHVAAQKARTELRQAAVLNGFGLKDFGNALSHPFKFKASLVLGAIMFAFLSVGSSAASFGGIFLMSAAIFCYMLANTLTFGIFANTIDNFSQGQLDENFMPSFDDFSIWDDVIQPFFLSIAVYVSSFGPFLVLMIAAIFFFAGSVTKQGSGSQSEVTSVVAPQLDLTVKSANQSERVREILRMEADEQRARVEAMDSGNLSANVPEQRKAVAMADEYNADTEKMVAEANALINQQRKAQLESSLGKTPETLAAERSAAFSQILDYGAIFLLLAAVTLVWGFIYFPAACAVAGYTRSFGATLNPAVGIDTIRRLGFDYVKLLLMVVVIFALSAAIGSVIHFVFADFDMPAVGNLPATVIGSLFTFYFSIVFSCLIGYALFNAADRLDLYSR
ncbi:MAG: hypothetical protein WBO10_08620 [Pyrinomonadaceae bacterium]